MDTIEIVCPCDWYDENTDAPEHETCECGHLYDEHDRHGCTIMVTVTPRRREAP